jgi:hypothetical protein
MSTAADVASGSETPIVAAHAAITKDLRNFIFKPPSGRWQQRPQVACQTFAAYSLITLRSAAAMHARPAGRGIATD